ncbi:MAG: aldose epimerase family protein [Bacteroidales bacterium]|nr:aldose epimerase family protein [Bacteroidales bacterium]
MNVTKTVASSPRGEIAIYKITNAAGAWVELSALGAGINAVVVPDKEGNLENVALGYADAASYIGDGPCMGKIPGRYANRIAAGKFTLDGVDYQLEINNGPNALHGGSEGFFNKIWDSEATDCGVVFSLVSPDGEAGYPGTLKVTAEYTWTDACELRLVIKATTDKKTVINLTNHAYFNLRGEASGSVLGQKLMLNCSHFLVTDENLTPTGEIAPVAGTPMDFTTAKTLGEDIRKPFPALAYGKGYDNCYAIDGAQKGEITLAAVLEDEATGRVLEVSTTQPAVQIYTGNWLSGCPATRSGNRTYFDYDGVAIECQGMPDAPNHPNFPSQVLDKGEQYEHTISFLFKTK